MNYKLTYKQQLRKRTERFRMEVAREIQKTINLAVRDAMREPGLVNQLLVLNKLGRIESYAYADLTAMYGGLWRNRY